MRITTFFIDKFKEVSFPTPIGMQEEGGVYGDEMNYSSWNLNTDETGTSDFVGVTRTNILYGELFKITLDTGNDFNTNFVPRLNDFHNMNLQDYWAKILSGEYTFNGIKYSDYRPTATGLARPTGRGQVPGGGTGGPTGGGTPTVNTTLLQYVIGVKERIGWVEVNRTRASIYYEICNGGKIARSDHFYDATKFIVTPELFDPNNENFITNPNNLSPLISFSYEKINPYSPEERFFTVSTNGSSPQRIGLPPIDNWFQWNNTSQRHVKIYKGEIPNQPNSVIGGFTTFPWPMGPMWGNISTQPDSYLISIATGNHVVLDADPYSPPFQTKLQIPSELGRLVSGVPLLTANRENHLNAQLNSRLIGESQFGTIEPISPVYPINIWGEKRFPESNSTIQIGFLSNIQTPSFGKCQKIQGFENSISDNISIIDPFGLELYDLDKQYKDVYSKFKFCPPRKKSEYELESGIPTQIPQIVEYLTKNSLNSNQIAKINTNNVEEYNLGGSTKIVKFGPFNPDANFLYDKSKFSIFKESSVSSGSSPMIKISNDLDFFESDIIPQYFEESLIENVPSLVDEYYTNPSPPFDDAIDDIFLDISASKSDRKFYDTPNYSTEKIEFKSEIYSMFNNQLEIENGIRNPNDFLTTSTAIPYGTYFHTLEKNNLPNGDIEDIIKIKQNGASADKKQFENAVSSILKLAGADKNPLKITGVSPNGFPIYIRNNFEESLSNLTEQLTGVKEIVFRGSDVLNGVVSIPKLMTDPTNIDGYLQVPEKIEYVNTGIYVTGSVDLSVGEKVPISHTYNYFKNSYLNLDTTSQELNVLKEKNLKSGSIEFIGNHKKENSRSQLSDDQILLGNGRGGIYFKSVAVKKGSVDEAIYLGLGWAPIPKTQEFYWNLSNSDTEYLVISKFDAFGDERKFWARTIEDNNDKEIKSTKTGTLFLNSVSGLVEEYTFQISGNILEFDRYYKIPVKYVGASGGSSIPSSFGYQITYSSKNTTTPPSKQRTITSTRNTYGGWIFSGLWHRDGLWPIDHKFRSGLLGNLAWTPCDGGVNTGAWIKVPDDRVRIEYHDFNTYSRDTVYSYFHDIWLSIKDKIWAEEQFGSEKLSDSIPLSPYTRDNLTWNRNYQPSDYNFETLESWEQNIVTQRNLALNDLRSIAGKVLILRMRSNDPDPSRGLDTIKIPKYNIENNGGLIPYYKPNHFLEEWITAIQFGDDKIMDNKLNYTLRWYPEPTEHTLGLFKPDEWYKAVFLRVVTSPSNPNGQIAGEKSNGGSCRDIYNGKNVEGKYPTNEENIRTFCDLLYTSEEVLKMHRARLVEMKKYIDAKTNTAQNSNSDFAKNTFSRSMKYVNTLREFMRLIK